MRQKSTGSLKKNIPMTAVPKAPMPVQTAYAVPSGMVLSAWVRKSKLSQMQTRKPNDGHSRVKLSDSFRQVVKPISRKPAKVKYNQLMLFLAIAHLIDVHP